VYVFLLCHVFAGMALGIAVRPREGTGAAVAAAVAGAIFPDLIDKPLGYLFFSGNLHQGRIFFHTLVVALLVLVLAILAVREKAWDLALLFAGGFLLHQLLDLMWQAPVHWFYPFLGPFPMVIPLDFFRWSLVAEFTSVSEWVFLLPVVVVVIMLYTSLSPGTAGSLLQPAARRIAPFMVPLLAALAVAGVLAVLSILPFPLTAGSTPEKEGIIALVALAGAIILTVRGDVLATDDGVPTGKAGPGM
jgi:membrane-bound metal-dependent hydrolase YbcI (DUF457 family)